MSILLNDNPKKATSIVEHIIYESWGKGNFSRHDEVIAKDVKCHFPSSWGAIHNIQLNNRHNARILDQAYAQAFQFHKVEIKDLIIGQEKILVCWSSEGIHKGDFFSFKASSRSVHLIGQTIYQFNKQEQVAGVWHAWDMFGLVNQIGGNQAITSLQNTKSDKRLKKLILLSNQEKECLRYLLEGKTAKETAAYMNLSFRTVEYYFENIKNKLTCYHKRELLAYARLLEKMD